MKDLYKFIPVLAMLFFAACGDDSSSASSEDPEDTSSSSEEVSSSSSSAKEVSSSSTKKDVSSSSEEMSSSSKKDISSSSESLTDPTKIFKTRVPKREIYTCKPPKGSDLDWEEKFDQVDWICSFKYDGDEGYVYVQGSPTSCEARFSMIPVMSIDTAVSYINGKYETLEEVSYDWGGNHHNDRIRFSYDGKVFEYNHSSYGWGGRSCQEMDCLKVYEADGKTLIEDGCGLDADISNSRKLPVVCRAADDDGKFDKFTDTFQLCMGDNRVLDPAQ